MKRVRHGDVKSVSFASCALGRRLPKHVISLTGKEDGVVFDLLTHFFGFPHFQKDGFCDIVRCRCDFRRRVWRMPHLSIQKEPRHLDHGPVCSRAAHKYVMHMPPAQLRYRRSVDAEAHADRRTIAGCTARCNARCNARCYADSLCRVMCFVR